MACHQYLTSSNATPLESNKSEGRLNFPDSIGIVWPALTLEGGEGVPGTRGHLGVLSVLPQGHSTLVELAGLR
jgi:hypothetical protein